MNQHSVPLTRTVLGDVPAETLGIMLPHEHVLVDVRDIWGIAGNDEVRVTRENREEVAREPVAYKDCLVLDDIPLAILELQDFKANGGGGIADVTPEGIGGNREALVEIARATGLHIVSGCGPYVEAAHHPRIKNLSIEQLGDELIASVVDGIEGTSVRAGIIGEIGTSEPVTPDETKALTAAAHAQTWTGCAITIHTATAARTGHEILSVIESAGGDLSRVVLGHMDIQLYPQFDPDTAVQHQIELARRGAMIEYDLCGIEAYVPSKDGAGHTHPTDDARADAILALIEAGYLKQVLLAHDVCKKIQLKEFGGPGYSHTITGFKDKLVTRGLTDEMLDEIYVENPKRILGIDPTSKIFMR